MNNLKTFLKQFSILIFVCLMVGSCGGWNPQDAKKTPASGPDRARKNVNEGKGVSINTIRKGIGKTSTNYEFSTSNPLWRATFDIIDFMPLVTVDYSGGTIITDWYTDGKMANESLKFTIRFLSNEIRSDSLKVIVHKRVCKKEGTCAVQKISSKLEAEIRTAIIRKAALLDRDNIKNDKKEKNKKEKKGFFNFGKSETPDEIR